MLFGWSTFKSDILKVVTEGHKWENKTKALVRNYTVEKSVRGIRFLADFTDFAWVHFGYIKGDFGGTYIQDWGSSY